MPSYNYVFLGYLRFQIVCVFAENMIISILNCLYMNFRINLKVLYQFLETETSDITYMGRDQELK